MNDAADKLPDDLASALAVLAKERARRITAEANAATAKADAATAKEEAASAKALVSHSEALIARLKLEIEKVRRELYGSRSERKARLLDQMELQLEELEADAGEDELVAETAAKASAVRAFERKRPSRKPFPEHLPRTVRRRCAARTEQHHTRIDEPRSSALHADQQSEGQQVGVHIGSELFSFAVRSPDKFRRVGAIATGFERYSRQTSLHLLQILQARGSRGEVDVA